MKQMEYININRTCRLCLENSNSTFKVLDEMVQYNLNSIQLYLDPTITDEPVICETCAKNLQQCLDFKATCMLNIDPIVSGKSNSYNFQDVYKNQIANKLRYYNICRFCMKVVKCGGTFTCLQNVDTEMVQKHFPELYIHVTEPTVVCTTCHKSLQHHFNFLKCCLRIEEKIMEYCKTEGTNSEGLVDLRCVATFVPKDILRSYTALVKVDSIEIKKESDLEIKQEVDVKLEPVEVKIESIGCDSPQSKKTPQTSRNNSKRSEVASYDCTKCTFKTAYKKDLLKHIRVHKKNNHCPFCEHQSKYRYDFLKHMEIHKSSTDSSKYRCTECGFETKYKECLLRHIITHKTKSPKVAINRCTECSFEGKNKKSLTRHMVTHKSESPKVAVNRCTECTFETKYKGSLIRHMIIHKSGSDVIMHKCTQCSFETKYEESLPKHLLTHWDVKRTV